MSYSIEDAPAKAVVRFDCRGKAVGKMRNELAVSMVKPWEESFDLASDEGAFHGGEGSAPPPLALFVAGFSGCVMTQIRAFAKRLGVTLNDLEVEVRVQWDWTATGATYETAPRSFEVDVDIDSPDPREAVEALIAAARKGCFIGQTLGRVNAIRHRLRTPEGWIEV